MKIFPFFIFSIAVSLCCISWNRSLVSKKETFQIKGTLFLIQKYCGGMAPTEQMRIASDKPFPYPNRTIYLRQGNGNFDEKKVIDSITSDSLGNFSHKLKAGIYCIVEKQKTVPFKYPVNTAEVTWDTACYRKNYQRCDFVLEVNQNLDSLKIVMSRDCYWKNPCMKTYIGPRPSSARPGMNIPSGKDISKPK